MLINSGTWKRVFHPTSAFILNLFEDFFPLSLPKWTWALRSFLKLNGTKELAFKGPLTSSSFYSFPSPEKGSLGH